MEKRETGRNRRLRLRNRQTYCAIGIGAAEADAIFNLRLAGLTTAEIVVVLEAERWTKLDF